MSARGWLGLALVVLALCGLAAVLPQGRTTLEELAPHASRAPSIDPDDLPTPTSFPTFTSLPPDISEEELQKLLEQLRAAGLSGALPVPPNMSMPSLTEPPEAASDRESGPENVTCIVFYSRSLECHNRGGVFKDVERTPNGQYRFDMDQSGLVQFQPGPPQTGEVTSTGMLPIDVTATGYTIIPSIAPNQHLVSTRIVAGDPATQVRLYRDVNDMVWAQADRTANIVLEITWAFSLDYYSLTWPSGHSFSSIPSSMRPPITEDVAAIGRQIAAHVGVSSSDDYSQAIRELAEYFQEFGEGEIPGRDQYSDDMLAIAYGENGCCRHRSQAFLVSAQSLGAPTRMVVNEAHAFVEVWFPQQGWRMIDLGGCGTYDIQNVNPDHQSIPVDTDVSDNYEGNDPGGPDPGPVIATVIEITEFPGQVRRSVPFRLAGTVAAAAGSIPANTPITIYYNETKETPGHSFCATQTTGGSTWSVDCELPPEAPVSSLQLVAHLAAARIGDQRTAPAYSDPQIHVLSTTNLTIEGSPRTAIGVDIAFTAVLTDDSANPVPNAQILFQSLGENQESVTDSDGRAQFAVRFSNTGTFQLRARFPGNDLLEADEATLSVTAIDLDVDATLRTEDLDSGTLRVTGRIADDLGGVPSSPLRFQFAIEGIAGAAIFGSDGTTRSPDGTFDLRLEGLAIKPGAHVAQLELRDFGITLDLPFTKTVTTQLTLETPERADVVQGIRFGGTVKVPGPDSVDIASLVRVTFVGPTTVMTDAVAIEGVYTGTIMLPAGNYTATAQLPARIGYTAASATDDVRVGIVSHTAKPRPAVVAPGDVLTLEGRILFDGQPLPLTALTASLADAEADDATATDGTYGVHLRVPTSLFVGTTKAQVEIPSLGRVDNIEVLIGEPTRFQVDASRVAFSFGEPISASVRYIDKEGNPVELPYNLTVDGKPIDGTSAEFVLSGTWFARVSTIEAESQGAGSIAGTRLEYQVLILNPLIPAILVLVVGAGLAVFLVRRSRGRPQQSIAMVASAAAPPPPAPGELPSAHLVDPKPVGPLPAVFDPAFDPTLTFQNSYGSDARVTLDDKPWPAVVQGDAIKISIADVALGVHRLEFSQGAERAASFTFNASPYHPPVEQSGRALVGRVRGRPLADADPTRLSWFVDEVARLRVPFELANEFQAAYEEALYAGRDCTRAQFARYFDAYFQIDGILRAQQPGRNPS